MGRKVNPKGMRLGVTSSWDNLSGTQLDHELLKVREYMNTVLEENGYLVGETNYHISKYKLVMHITISSLDIKKVMTQEKWKKLQEDCEKLIKQSNRVDITNMKIEMICHYVSWERFDTKLITKWLVKELEKGGQIPELRDILVDWYKDSKYIGMKVKISGRINGVEMAQIENFSFGKVTTQTLKYKVDFYQQQAFTISGVLGVSVWLVETNIKEKEKKCYNLKKRKFPKAHKGKVSKKIAVRGITITHGKYGIIALEPGRIDAKEIEAARVALNRKIKKYGALWIRIFPNIPVTKKPAEMRMGQGKGPVITWIARVRTNKILMEVSKTVPEPIAIAGLRAASFKFSVKTKIIKK